jgi:aromatic ring-opening dioxygenase catalytic subunit (LigB family)
MEEKKKKIERGEYERWKKNEKRTHGPWSLLRKMNPSYSNNITLVVSGI